MTLTELVTKFARKFNMPVEDFSANSFVTPSIFRTFGFPGCVELANMFQFEMDFSELYCANRDVETTRTYNPALMSFELWLDSNKDKIPWVGKQGGLEAGGEAKTDTPVAEKKVNIEDIGFSLTLDPEAARARSAMIQKQVDISKQNDVWKEAFKTATSGKTEMSLEEAKSAGISAEEFKKLDVEGHGFVSREEFLTHMTGVVESDLAMVRAKFFICGAMELSRQAASRAGARGSVDAGAGMQLTRERAVRSGIRGSVFDGMNAEAGEQVSVEGLAKYLTTHEMAQAANSSKEQ